MVDVAKINNERLNGWKEKLTKAHATPVALIGVGHDHVSGQIHLVITEDVDIADIKKLLWNAYHQIP